MAYFLLSSAWFQSTRFKFFFGRLNLQATTALARIGAYEHTTYRTMKIKIIYRFFFLFRKKSTLSTPILKSYSNLLWYHLGTVALGGLLIAIVQVIRAIFSTMKSFVKDPKNDFTRAIYKGFSCCLYCLEKILVFLTRNAYIEVGECYCFPSFEVIVIIFYRHFRIIFAAIFGDNLWTSGKRAYHVLVNNSLRVIAINSVGDFVLFLGKALVVACSVFIGVRILQVVS